ncbi:MAG: gliding motility-associated C-terminal domain-containing protein, partial [Bacteroidota bacterium]|nr:gliding motility-associated C-terminal domain-containing protein [Bacteroidota bacterium]
NWIKTEATITDSDCDHFILNGSYTGADLSYIDPVSHEKVVISADYNVSWKEGDAVVSHTLKTTIFSPPSENTTYNLTLTDKFGCNAKVSVVYNSLVPSADFTVSPDQGEAPLLVKFTNLSKNADRYTWTLYKDIDVIKTEAEKNSGKVDSVMQQFQTSNIEYKYENSGHYKVKLLAIKTNPDNLTCRDSLYLRSGFIVADTSWVEVPNVFTPNGDNVNDRFTIKTQSLKTFKVSIFNRWGRKLFSYENNNVSSSTETTAHGVWDGKIDGKYASPGVYFYVIEAIGRDNRSRKKTGFVHLFRDK